MKQTLFLSCLALFVAGCSSAPKEPEATTPTPEPSAAAPAPEPTMVAFADIQPILQKNCLACHSENGQEGIDMRTYESLMKGGGHGAIVTAGDGAGSTIVKAMKGDGVKQMPPTGAPVSAEDIAKVEAWITAGAKS